MEADWDEPKITRIPFPPPGVHALPTPVSTSAFDYLQELYWAGNEYGRVSSYYGPELQKYTSFKAHASEGAVKQLLFNERGVISVASRSIHLSTRRGLAQWHITHEDMTDLRCMSFTSNGAMEILVAGCQAAMYRVDVEKGEITHTLQAEDNYTLMKRGGSYICAATNHGYVHILDPKTFRVVTIWQAHPGGFINDMDAKSEFLVTCGYSQRGALGFLPDPFTRVFDLKMLHPVPAIPVHAGAACVRMHPKMSTTSFIMSRRGQLHIVDILNPNTVSLRQTNIYDTYVTSIEIAPSGEALAFTDTTCCIHLWGSPSKIQFTEYSNPTEFADPPMPTPKLDWSVDTPLSMVGMPYYREVLLSAWPSHMVFEVGAPPPKIDPELLVSLKRAEMGGYAPNPRKTRRNQVENTRAADKASSSISAPKFLSEKAKDAPDGTEGRRMSEILEALTDAALDGSTKKDVPVIYRNVEIKYSKFGVEDFDFEYYNKTEFSGLETHIANSYANPLLQLLRFTPVIRNLALLHTATTSCLYDTCLLCEMGFLFDMLEKAKGQNCQATNFLKTFSSLSAAAPLGLLEEHSSNSPLTVMIQGANRFLLDKIVSDYRQMLPASPHMGSALTTGAVESIRCSQCRHESIRPAGTLVHELIYPAKNNTKSQQRTQRPTFSQILKSSVERQEQKQGWCDVCRRYPQLSSRRTIQSMPAVLMINAAVRGAEAKQIWATPRWLPQKIGVIVDRGSFFCFEGQDVKWHLRKGVHPVIVYELVGIVADISSGENQKSHLVSMINVAISSRTPSIEDDWHLFNDFLVRRIPKDEALRFDPTWMLPSILTYQVTSAKHGIDDSWKNNLDTSLLYRRYSMHTQNDPSTFRTLNPQTEAPHQGYVVAIDAEFVALQQEEIEIKADGTRETVRPSRLGLARVSVLRGAGVDEGLPFIDEYIHITEPVVDYLTAYSGISPGDLDPKTSRHALVSLKVAYKKLWLLLNLGCIFVGHGLLKDFRIINIHVPKAQVVDTVNLFYIPARQRKLNLRFLAWFFLREDIQQGTHDSVEDARTALRLWRKYEEFVDAGILETMLNDVYAKGRETGFKAPSALKENLSLKGRKAGVDTPPIVGEGPAGQVTSKWKGGAMASGSGIAFRSGNGGD